MKGSTLLDRLFKSTFMTMFFVELSNTVSCVVDGLVTGRFLGGTQLAAYGLAAPYFSIAAIISGILMVGGQTLCAKCIGSGDREGAGRTFSTLCVSGIVISLITAVLGIVFSDRIAMLFGARGDYAELLPYTSAYLKGLFFGTPFLVMMAVLAPVAQLDGGAASASLASAAVTVVDIAADLIGVLVFKGGLMVIAAATSLSYFAGAAVLVSHFMKKDSLFMFSVGDYELTTAKSIIKDGLPRGASMLCRLLGPIIINLIVLGAAGTAGMTAMSVQSNVKFLIGAPACGIAGAVLLMSSLYVGEKDKTLLKETFALSLKYTALIIGGIAALTFIFAGPIALFYLPDDISTVPMAADAIRWYAVSLPLMAINLSLAGFLQAIGKSAGAYLMNIGIELVCVVSCVLILVRIFGVDGIWAGFAAGQLLLLVLYLTAALLQRNKPRRRAEQLLFLSDDFGIPDENRLSASSCSLSDVASLSVETGNFCRERGIDGKRSYLAALFVEEMAGNVIEHGFTDGKEHILETVVAIDGEDVIIRVRDDCPRFDLKEKAENWKLDPEHPERNIGIRMMLGMAKDISYAGSMNTNNVIIKI